MSRTYRSKNNRSVWLQYDNENEFEVARACSLKDYSDMLSRKPKRPSGGRWVKTKCNWDTCRTEYTLNTDPVVVAEWAAWDDYHYSYEYMDFKAGVRFVRYTRNAKTYKEYVRNEEKLNASDGCCGPSWCGNAPARYCNQYYERPMRRSVKAALKKAYKYDTFDETVYEETLNGAAWSYW